MHKQLPNRAREESQLTPFLKWAGGKRWLTDKIVEALPRRFRCYIEPFLGSGAVYFALQPQRAILADLNSELITTYEAIRLYPSEVWAHLAQHAANHSDAYYYQLRALQPRRPAEQAARLLYLNRTCWNGLFRVNRQGVFNVPVGTKTSVLLQSDNPARISKLLLKADLVCSDFEMIVDCAQQGDIIYADPPYTVRHNLNGFLKYNESIFQWADQERLALALERARLRGAYVVVSNANHGSIRQLYQRTFRTIKVTRHSILAANPRKRTRTSELLLIGTPHGKAY